MNNITVITLLSRDYCINNVINNIKNLDISDFDAKFIIILDNKRIDRYAIQRELKDYNVSIHSTGKYAGSEVNIVARRQRILENFEFSKKYINSEYLFVFEDDSILESDTLQKLWSTYEMCGDNVGLVSGIQVGRWASKIIGAWQCNNYDRPTKVYTIDYLNRIEPIQQVDATGFYCFLIKSDLFKKEAFKQNHFGPDVNFGFDLRRQGYFNYIDWDVIIPHLTREGILYPDNDCVQLTYTFKENYGWKKIEK